MDDLSGRWAVGLVGSHDLGGVGHIAGGAGAGDKSRRYDDDGQSMHFD